MSNVSTGKEYERFFFFFFDEVRGPGQVTDSVVRGIPSSFDSQEFLILPVNKTLSIWTFSCRTEIN